MNNLRNGRRSLSAAIAFLVLIGSSARHASGELPVLAPEELGLCSGQLALIDDVVARALEAEKMPGCVVAIGRTGGIGFLKAYGHRQLEPEKEEMTVDTLFDMASLTKPVATATSIMLLVERGEVRLHDSVTEYIPEFDQEGKGRITVEDLLVHRGGLIPDNSLKDYDDPEKTWERIFALKPQHEPGERFIYSDVGYLVLGEIVHRVTGETIADFAAENIYNRLGMNETGYKPSKKLRQRAATTEKVDDKWLRGEVHDPRAYRLGGVAGHAGLFSTAKDLAIYGDAMLRGAREQQSQAGRGVPAPGAPLVMSPAAEAEMCRPRDVAGNKRMLGWDNRSGYSTNRGELMSERAFGHGGFTGTAMWIDPELDLFVIFLSNRVHPDGKGSVNPLAGRIGSIAAAAIAGQDNCCGCGAESGKKAGRGVTAPGVPTSNAKPHPADRHPVLTGIDVLERDGFKQLKGRKIGLITNHTGVNHDGRRTIDLLHEADGVELVAIFSPEHGIAGALDHDGIGDSKDEATGRPVYSLYGENREPTEKQLEGIDTLVFDIQDVGARFYTYMSTMAWALKAAAANDLHYVVLDRPNPIGGVEVAGPVIDEGAENFTSSNVLPLRHGMTAGELAKMYQAEKLDGRGSLEVIEVENWPRGDYWDATGLMWINPSPNMRSLTQAVLYPGMGLWEFTNISVGRGTDTPFEVLGAPWIDAKEFAAAMNAADLPGVRFIPIEFTPRDSKFVGQKCGGVNVHIVERSKVDPVAIGLEIGCTLRRLYPKKWETEKMDRLLKNEKLQAAILDGESRSQLDELYQLGLDEFKKRRTEFLIYED